MVPVCPGDFLQRCGAVSLTREVYAGIFIQFSVVMFEGGQFVLAMALFMGTVLHFTEYYLYLATMNDYLTGVFAALRWHPVIINS